TATNEARLGVSPERRHVLLLWPAHVSMLATRALRRKATHSHDDRDGIPASETLAQASLDRAPSARASREHAGHRSHADPSKERVDARRARVIVAVARTDG